MPVSRNAISGNSAPVSDNSIPKLDRKYTHIVNNDASVGLNGVPGQHEVSDTTRGNAFLEGMSNVFNTVGNAVGQGVNKLKQALVSSGNASWFGGEEQKAAAEQALKEKETANREAINEYRDYRNTLKEEHPIAYGAGDFLTKSQLYRGAGGLGAATGAEAALSGKIGETGANLALGQAADVLLDTIPTEIENYQNGMRGTDLATDTLKNLGVNAAFNLGAEGLGMIPGLLKGMRKPAEEVAEEAVETAAKSAPDALKQIEPEPIKQLEPVAEPANQINPLGMATNDAELEALAAQRQSAVDAIDAMREQIPAQPVPNNQTVETLTNAAKPENGANRSALQEITDSMINTRNTENLVGNGNSEAGKANLKNIDELQKQEKSILGKAEKITNDPTLEQLKNEAERTSEAYWNTITRVDNPIDPEAVNIHRQALENLDNYMNNNTRQSLTDSLKGLEIEKSTRKGIRNNLKTMDGVADRIMNAQSAEEVNSILSEAEKMAGDTEALLKKSAQERMIKKGDFDEPTQAFVNALNGKKIYLSPEVRANFTDMNNINDFGDQLYFNGNSGRFKPAFRATNKDAIAIDQLFPEIDRETGHALSNFMKDNGLNPGNAADQVRGLLDYGNYLKSNKDSLKVRPYEGGVLDDFMGNLRKAAEDKLNTFKETVTPEPRLKPNLQFFAEKGRDVQRQIDNMKEGAEKENLKAALNDYWGKVNNSTSNEEAEEALNNLNQRLKVSKAYTNTLKNSGLLTEEELAKHTLPKSFTYEEIPEQESLARAIKMRQEEGEDFVKNRLDQNEALTGAETDGMMLAYNEIVEKARALEEKGEDANELWNEANTIFRKVQTEASRNGQAVQALKKWKNNTAIGMLSEAERIVNKELDNLANQKGIPQIEKSVLDKISKREKFEFSVDFQKKFLDEAEKVRKLDPDSRDFKIGYAKLGVMVNDEIKKHKNIPQKAGNAITSLLMDNMLGNFRTLITRNAGGNLGLAAAEQTLTRPLAALIDRLVSTKTGKRTQAGLSIPALGDYFSGFGKGIKEEGQDILEELKLHKGIHTSRSGEVSLEDAIARNMDTFKTDSKNPLIKGMGVIGQIYDNAVAHGLSVGDRPFYEANYKQTLGDLKRFREKGLLGDKIQKLSDRDFDILSKGIAKYNALTSVYQNDSLMSDALMGFKNSIGELSESTLGFDILSQFSMPFVKTPANVVDRAIDYSPLGIVRNAVRTTKEGGIGGKDFNQNRFVNEAARNIIGTGLMTGAGVAASKGVLSGKYSKDPDQKKAQRESGMQEYALNIPFGDDNYQMDISWIPIVGSNSVASAAAVNAAQDSELSPADKALAGLKGGGKAMLDQSFFQGMQRLFGQGDTYNSDEGIVGNMINTVKSGVTQAVPSLARQAAQVADPYERDLSNGDYDINNIKNTIPGMRQTLQPKVNTEGEYVRQNQGRNVGMKILEDMILPGKVTKIETPELTAEAERLQGLTGNNYAYQPKASKDEITTDYYEPTPEEYTQYQVERNKAMTSTGKELLKSDYYKSATPKQQEAMLQNMYQGIKDYAKAGYTGEEVEKKVGVAYNVGKEKEAVKEIIYHDILSNYGLSDGDAYRKIYQNEGEAALKEYAEYKAKENNYKRSHGLESMTKDDKMTVIRKEPLSTQKKLLPDMLTSQEDKERWEAAGQDVTRYWKLYDAAQNKKAADEKAVQNTIKSAGIGDAEQTQKELASYGASDSPTTVEYYAKAKSVIPSLSTKEYAGYLKDIGGSDRKISQTELIDYANRKNLPEGTMNTYWKAFENKKGWKQIPKLKKGKWTASKR